MGTYSIGVAAQLLENGQFAQAKAVVQYKSHADGQFVFACDGVFDPPQMLYLQVIRVEVIAHAVLVGEEWLAGVLRSYNAKLYVVVVAELVALPVAVAVAEISILVALALVAWYANIAHQFVATVLEYVFQTREDLLGG